MSTSRLWLAAGLFAVAAYAANWQFLVGSADDSRFYEIDTASIARVDASTRKAWFKETLVKAEWLPAAQANYGETKQLLHVKCAERTSATAQRIYYTEGGKVVYSKVLPKEALFFADVIPDSIGEAMLDAVCTPASKATP